MIGGFCYLLSIIKRPSKLRCNFIIYLYARNKIAYHTFKNELAPKFPGLIFVHLQDHFSFVCVPLLKLMYIYKLQTLIFMNKVWKNLLPAFFMYVFFYICVIL